MSSYVYGAGWSYQAYLQARSFEADLHLALSAQTSALVASADELDSRNQRRFEGLQQTLAKGFSELNSTLQWGFSEILLGLQDIAAEIGALRRIASTPEQTWAFEQYEQAREAQRRGLAQESHKYLSLAINGNGNHLGNSLEYRFFFFRGTLFSGAGGTGERELDLSRAEADYLEAARLTERVEKEVAARSLCAASWVAYSAGKPSVALQHVKRAISLNSKLAEARFLNAKYLFHVGEIRGGLDSLYDAIDLDVGYSVRTLEDGDFKKDEVAVRELLNTFRSRFKTRFESLRRALKGCSLEFNPVRPEATRWIDSGLAAAEVPAGSNTIIGLAAGCDILAPIALAIPAHVRDAREQIVRVADGNKDTVGGSAFWISAAMFLLGSCGACEDGEYGSALKVIIIGLVVSAAIGLGARAIVTSGDAAFDEFKRRVEGHLETGGKSLQATGE